MKVRELSRRNRGLVARESPATRGPRVSASRKGDVVKRFSIMFLILGLILGSVATAEAKQKQKRNRVERTVKGSYGVYPAPITGCSGVLSAWACLRVSTRPAERFFTAKVSDAHGQPVFVEVRSGGARVAVFCGETSKPIAIKRGSVLEFHVALENWPGHVGPDCPANRIKTTGTIRVTLSNLP